MSLGDEKVARGEVKEQTAGGRGSRGEHGTERQENGAREGVALQGQARGRRQEAPSGAGAGPGGRAGGRWASGRLCLRVRVCLYLCPPGRRPESGSVQGRERGQTAGHTGLLPPGGRTPHRSPPPDSAHGPGAGECTAPRPAPPRRGRVPAPPTPSLDLAAGPWADGGSLAAGPTARPADAPGAPRAALAPAVRPLGHHRQADLGAPAGATWVPGAPRPPGPGCPDAGATLPVAARCPRRGHAPPEPKEKARYTGRSGRVAGQAQRGRRQWPSKICLGH